MMIRFVVDIEPGSMQNQTRTGYAPQKGDPFKGKGPRCKCGRLLPRAIRYDTPKKKEYEAAVGAAAAAYAPRKPFDVPVAMSVVFYRPRPKTRPKWIPKEAWKTGAAIPLRTKSSHDCDNLSKSFIDGLVGFWTDDGVICDLHIRKFYAAKWGRPCAVVRIWPIDF